MGLSRDLRAEFFFGDSHRRFALLPSPNRCNLRDRLSPPFCFRCRGYPSPQSPPRTISYVLHTHADRPHNIILNRIRLSRIFGFCFCAFLSPFLISSSLFFPRSSTRYPHNDFSLSVNVFSNVSQSISNSIAYEIIHTAAVFHFLPVSRRDRFK